MTVDLGRHCEGAAEIELLRQLVEIESPSFDVAASDRIATMLEARFAELGASVRLIATDTGTNLVVDAAGAGQTDPGAPDHGRFTDGPAAPLLLVGHTDTVWPVGTIDSDVPWLEEGDRIAGPGVYDMKSGIVVMHAALSHLAARGHRPVRIVLTCDEEVGSPTTQSLLRELVAGAAGVLGFESPHADGALKVGRRGSSRIRITTHGRASHAALDPELGISAIDELVDQLMRVREITTADDLPAPVLCNVGMVEGGARTNVVPDRAAAEIGLRFVDPASEHRVVAELQGLTPVRNGARIDIDLLSHRPAWLPTDGDRSLFEGARAAAAGIGQRLEGRPASGAGDTNLLGSLGVPTLDGLGPRGGGAHAATEHIVVQSLFERIELLTAILSTDPRATDG